MISRGHTLNCKGCGIFFVRQGCKCPHCGTLRIEPAPKPVEGHHGYADCN